MVLKSLMARTDTFCPNDVIQQGLAPTHLSLKSLFQLQ